jgi:diadenosine tetraphosphatase ApaH/serine/threonine PP2A family protein phosphatase
VRLGVLGDVHANARALREALDLVQSRPIDQLVFLGDLLTYGPDVREVLELVAAETEDGAILLLGNHDAMYLDLMEGEQGYFDGLPLWVRESVDWTLGELDQTLFRSLPFVKEWTHEQLLAAHANPFDPEPGGEPSWRYLNQLDDYAEAARCLRDRDLRVGVFGHTHRPRIVEWPSGRGLTDERRSSVYAWKGVGLDDALLLNAGSVGQPRGKGGPAHVMWITVEEEVDVDLATVSYPVEEHVAALYRLPVSGSTVEALARFFRN